MGVLSLALHHIYDIILTWRPSFAL
jgi:hypothetical protein